MPERPTQPVGGTWLCSGELDRERLFDMDRRLAPVRRMSMGVLAVALLACGPWLGFWTLIPLVIAAGMFTTADLLAARVAKPEYVMFAAWLGSEITIAASVVLAGGPTIATMGWFAIPIVTLSARFHTRGVLIGVTLVIALMCGVAFGDDAGAIADDPTLLIIPLALVISIGMLSTALMASDVEHRSEAVIDQLTGMLNRKALATRTGELTQQSAITGEPIGVIVGDLDHFKRVNDSHGHAVGDAVLKDVAYILRKNLRAFDLVYRLGGEEFLMLLPGAEIGHCAARAEELRMAMALATLPESVRLTMSFGVSASASGETFDYEHVFAEADAALYRAKHLGRDRVATSADAPAAAQVVA
jgi:diguanylate cyclase (GGDEF)-like protein